jgi:DNA mismatch repair ATPase MutS
LFYSILFPQEEQHKQPRQKEAPNCFKNLNLDQIFTPILKDKQKFELESFFYTSLQDPEIISYRQETMRELEEQALFRLLIDFSKIVYELATFMSVIQKALSSKDSYDNNYVTKGRMLDYAEKYCQAISSLLKGLSSVTLHSAGLRNFSDYLKDYHTSDAFTILYNRVTKLRGEFSKVQYCMLIKNGTIHIRKYEGQADHSKQIAACFAKFRQDNVKDYRHKLPEEPAAHVEAAVLKMLAGLYKDIFNDLNDFCAKNLYFVDDTIFRFSREIQFYLSWLDYIIPSRQAGLLFCYPQLSNSAERLYSNDTFDLALARKKQGSIVTNDFIMENPEHIIVVTGPNQGGKTTFARTFGQIHYLASLGLCVPGREAALYLFDNLFTHFGREEDLSTLNGKLQDDLIRLHTLLNTATDRSIIIINEIFASTTLNDALILGQRMMDAITALNAPAVIVTFLDELALHGPETISMMSTVKEDDPAERTFKIIRKPPDGLAYALHIAHKHNLTYEQLYGRLKK